MRGPLTLLVLGALSAQLGWLCFCGPRDGSPGQAGRLGPSVFTGRASNAAAAATSTVTAPEVKSVGGVAVKGHDVHNNVKAHGAANNVKANHAIVTETRAPWRPIGNVKVNGEKHLHAGVSLGSAANSGAQWAASRVARALGGTPPLVSDSTAVAEPTTMGDPEKRKLRSAIESIMRDQEDLRLSAPLLSGRVAFVAGSALGLATLGIAVASLPILGAVLVPALASGIFVYSSVAESTGGRAKGLARYNSAQALKLAAQQEMTLAEAELSKAFIPFGVGLTAILAAACVSIKIYVETTGEEGKALEGDPLAVPLLLLLGVASVAAGLITNDKALLMRTALSFTPKDRDEENLTDWEAKQLPRKVRTPEATERAMAAFMTLLLCFLPLPLAVPGLLPAVFGEVQGEEAAEVLVSSMVVISAVAAAQAAFILFVAERDFADAERRIAIQAKQAALAELFYAQSMAEAAVIPPGTAISGAALGGATFLVEFSTFLASLAVWPAVLSTFRSTLSSIMSRVEADASWLELQVSRKGRTYKKQSDAISSTVRELRRLQLDFQLDGFSNEVRKDLLALPVGEVKEFKMLDRDRRRKVHLVAAELGMASQSQGPANTRLVQVRNIGLTRKAALEDNPFQVQKVFEAAKAELKTLAEQGVPQEAQSVATVATLATLASVVSPVIAGKALAELVLPFVTGSVGLLTVWQERSGKEVVAIAKRQTAGIVATQAAAESFIGRATMAYGALPTDFAVATLSTTACVVCVSVHNYWLHDVLPPILLLTSVVAFLIALRRRSRMSKHVDRVVKLVDAQYHCSKPWYLKHWWLLPVTFAVLTPVPMPKRIATACAILMAQVGCIMAYASRDMGAASFFAARCARTVARADAWAQRAATDMRALPFESAAATVACLLSTAVVAFSPITSAIFPIVGLVVWRRALQFGTRSRLDAQEVANETQGGLQSLRKIEPWNFSEATGVSSMVAEGIREASLEMQLLSARKESPLPPPPTSEMAVGVAAARFQRRNSSKEAAANPLQVVTQTFSKLVAVWDDRKPEDSYVPGPSEVAVRSVQADLDEIRVSVRTNERNWFRTLSVIGFCAVASVVAPFVLSALATEVVLPVAGAGLTLFAVRAESEARRGVASSKVWAAELGAVVGTMEEVLSPASYYRSILIAWAGIAATIGVLALIAEHPWHGVGHVGRQLQKFWQVSLVLVQIVAAGYATLPLQGVWQWTDKTKKIASTSLRDQSSLQGVSPVKLANRRRGLKAIWKDMLAGNRVLPLLAILPPLLLAIFPHHRHFAKRAVASTAAGGFVIAVLLSCAEKSLMGAERAIAARTRTFTLTDTFANEAEQQGALLPVASAAAIAISGLITFGVELNPYAASILALLQAATWVLASRKALATKFESDAGLQVASVTEQPSFVDYASRSGDPGEAAMRRFKRMLLRVGL